MGVYRSASRLGKDPVDGRMSSLGPSSFFEAARLPFQFSDGAFATRHTVMKGKSQYGGRWADKHVSCSTLFTLDHGPIDFAQYQIS
jgi:hypothetical protein